MPTPKSRITFDGKLLTWPDGFTFAVDEIPAEMARLAFVFGVKQSISDAAAGAKSDAERRALMEKRAHALATGTWRFRDGLSEPSPAAKRDQMFDALVAEGVLAESARGEWAALTPGERNAVWALYPAAHARMAQLAPRAATAATLAKLGLA